MMKLWSDLPDITKYLRDKNKKIEGVINLAFYCSIADDKSSAKAIQIPVLRADINFSVIISRSGGYHAIGLIFP
jgi:hypothetical protein